MTSLGRQVEGEGRKQNYSATVFSCFGCDSLAVSKLSNWIDVVASACFTFALAEVQWGVAVDCVRLFKMLDVED